MSNSWVYALACPFTDEVRYVGRTHDLDVRFAQHMRNHHSMAAVRAWIARLAERGARPIIRPLYRVGPGESAEAREAHFITEHGTRSRLLNFRLPNRRVNYSGLPQGHRYLCGTDSKADYS